MRVWRLCKAKHAADPLSGSGARLYGGRWNHKGIRMVYAAESLALAALECLVHFEQNDMPNDYVAIGIEIPDSISSRNLAVKDLPKDWQDIPGPESLKALGTQWVRAGKEAVLIVPSAVVPMEKNILINPEHPESVGIKLQTPFPFLFDTRLLLLK
jgi:RES domain-containing protein